MSMDSISWLSLHAEWYSYYFVCVDPRYEYRDRKQAMVEMNCWVRCGGLDWVNRKSGWHWSITQTDYRPDDNRMLSTAKSGFFLSYFLKNVCQIDCIQKISVANNMEAEKPVCQIGSTLFIQPKILIGLYNLQHTVL